MPELDQPGDLGFAEFVAKLIGEVFEAVGAAQAEQNRKLGELAQLAALSADDFAARAIAEDVLEAELVRRFPAKRAREHAIVPDTEFKIEPGRADVAHEVARLLGRKPAEAPFTITLRAADVRVVRAAVRRELAAPQREIVQETVKRGVARVLVDSGRINAKLVFQVLDVDDANKPAAKKRLAMKLRALPFPVDLPQAPELSRLRLVVSPAQKSDSTQGQVFGEVEITFKTE
jgi:hypothetical protein